MRKTINTLFTFLFCLVLITSFTAEQLSAQQKLAQTSMKFLLVSTDARAAAMGDANIALEGNSSAMFFNPAGMARLQSLADVNVGQVQWIADIKYLHGAAAFAPFNGDYGVLGVSFVFVDYGDFQHTIRATNELGYLDLGTFSPSAYCIGVSYAKALSEKFSVGGTVKYALQDLTSSVTSISSKGYTKDSYKPQALVFDFGMLYHTGIQSLDFAASIRNFSKEITLVEEGFQLPLMFKVGFAYNASDIFKLDKSQHSIQLALDAAHPRDNKERIDVGVEYKFMNALSLRAGYSSPNDLHDFTYGVGFEQSLSNYMLGVDYAYTPWKDKALGDVHKFTVHFAL